MTDPVKHLAKGPEEFLAGASVDEAVATLRPDYRLSSSLWWSTPTPASGLPGFDRVEKWLSPEGDVVNAMYYFADRQSVAMLGRFPQHREAKGQVARWYDGYRIVVSDVRATYGDGRLPAPTGTSRASDDTPTRTPAAPS